MRISCSSKHAIVITNTGSAYSWGENNHGQLGYESAASKGKSAVFEQKPRKIEAFSKEFVIDAACGEHHSLVLTNQKEVYCFGSNKQNQLGFDPEMYPQLTTPKKLILQEYMNSSQKEKFNDIYACNDYSVLYSGQSQYTYVTDKENP